VSTVRHHAGDPHASFSADFLGYCGVVFPICSTPLSTKNSDIAGGVSGISAYETDRVS
jgi:hypothetical protein